MKKFALMSYWMIAAVTFAGAVAMIFGWTPEEATMGVIQKIFYFHLPVAINAFLACTLVCVGGVGYLITRKSWWDDFSSAAAKVAVVLCSGVLLSGILWARGAWNVWWTWSPRLTFSFMLWLLFVVYLIVRSSIDGAQRRAVVCAVFGLVAYLDVPLVWLSARLLPDVHPGDITLAASMKLTLGLSFIPITLITIGLIALQCKVHTARRAAEAERARESAAADAEAAISLSGGVV